MRNLFYRAIEGQTVGLVGAIRNSDGALLTSLSGYSLKAFREFDDFAEITTTPAATATLINPPKGTALLPDPRWSPGLDGEDGFNVKVSITFPEIGTYRVVLQVGGSVLVFKVHVGSGG